MSNKEEYKKCYEDEIDWVSVKQLHESTLHISNQCFEYKKLCVGIIGVLAAALFKLKLGTPMSLSVISGVCAVIGIGFWCCDSIAYFYQKSNRILMNEITSKIKARNMPCELSSDKVKKSWVKAFLNPSMSLYFYILAICFVAWIYDNAHWFEHTY